MESKSKDRVDLRKIRDDLFRHLTREEQQTFKRFVVQYLRAQRANFDLTKQWDLLLGRKFNIDISLTTPRDYEEFQAAYPWTRKFNNFMSALLGNRMAVHVPQRFRKEYPHHKRRKVEEQVALDIPSASTPVAVAPADLATSSSANVPSSATKSSARAAKSNGATKGPKMPKHVVGAGGKNGERVDFKSPNDIKINHRNNNRRSVSRPRPIAAPAAPDPNNNSSSKATTPSGTAGGGSPHVPVQQQQQPMPAPGPGQQPPMRASTPASSPQQPQQQQQQPQQQQPVAPRRPRTFLKGPIPSLTHSAAYPEVAHLPFVYTREQLDRARKNLLYRTNRQAFEIYKKIRARRASPHAPKMAGVPLHRGSKRTRQEAFDEDYANAEEYRKRHRVANPEGDADAASVPLPPFRVPGSNAIGHADTPAIFAIQHQLRRQQQQQQSVVKPEQPSASSSSSPPPSSSSSSSSTHTPAAPSAAASSSSSSSSSRRRRRPLAHTPMHFNLRPAPEQHDANRRAYALTTITERLQHMAAQREEYAQYRRKRNREELESKHDDDEDDDGTSHRKKRRRRRNESADADGGGNGGADGDAEAAADNHIMRPQQQASPSAPSSSASSSSSSGSSPSSASSSASSPEPSGARKRHRPPPPPSPSGPGSGSRSKKQKTSYGAYPEPPRAMGSPPPGHQSSARAAAARPGQVHAVANIRQGVEAVLNGIKPKNGRYPHPVSSSPSPANFAKRGGSGSGLTNGKLRPPPPPNGASVKHWSMQRHNKWVQKQSQRLPPAAAEVAAANNATAAQNGRSHDHSKSNGVAHPNAQQQPAAAAAAAGHGSHTSSNGQAAAAAASYVANGAVGRQRGKPPQAAQGGRNFHPAASAVGGGGGGRAHPVSQAGYGIPTPQSSHHRSRAQPHTAAALQQQQQQRAHYIQQQHHQGGSGSGGAQGQSPLKRAPKRETDVVSSFFS